MPLFVSIHVHSSLSVEIIIHEVTEKIIIERWNHGLGDKTLLLSRVLWNAIAAVNSAFPKHARFQWNQHGLVSAHWPGLQRRQVCIGRCWWAWASSGWLPHQPHGWRLQTKSGLSYSISASRPGPRSPSPRSWRQFSHLLPRTWRPWGT